MHMWDAHARMLGVENGDLLAVRVVSPKSSVVLEDVMVRTTGAMTKKVGDILESANVELGMECHLDTDEGDCPPRSQTQRAPPYIRAVLRLLSLQQTREAPVVCACLPRLYLSVVRRVAPF